MTEIIFKRMTLKWFLFQALEELVWQAGELIDRLDDLQEDVARADFADDVTGARRAIDAHADISKRLAKVPVDELEAQGEIPFLMVIG